MAPTTATLSPCSSIKRPAQSAKSNVYGATDRLPRTLDLPDRSFHLRTSTAGQLALSSPQHFELSRLDGKVEDNPADIRSSYVVTEIGPSLQQRRREETPISPDDEVTANDRQMSRTPLLLRTSPALGTGSYGGLPHHLALSDNDDAQQSSASNAQRMSRGKGKNALRRRNSAREEGNHQPSDAQKDVDKARKRRRSLSLHRRGSSSEDILEDAIEGAQEIGLEPRFTTSSFPAFDIGASSAIENLDALSDSDIDGGAPNGAPNGAKHHKAHHSIDMPDEEITDNSPYAQVRASVSPVDNTTLSINTPRMWALSILFAIFGSATNLFFSLRYPSVSITPVIALLIVHPMGLLWDRALKRSDDPDEFFENGTLSATKDHDSEYESRTAASRASPSRPAKLSPGQRWKRRFRLWLAQGRWNEKEHCCVFISSNVSFGFAFATDVSRIIASPNPF